MEKENKFANKNVHTYTEDMAEAIEGGEGGIIKKIIHQEEEHQAENKNLSPQSKKNQLFMFFSVLLILFASIILITFLFFRKNSSTVPIAPQFVPIIFTDQSFLQEVAGLDKDQLITSIINKAHTIKVKTGSLEGIYLTENKAIVGLREFTKLIKGNLLPSIFVEDNFLIGTVQGQDLFILLKMRSLSDIFEGMHTWEKKMLFDLHGLFGVNISPETNYLFTKDFEDGIIQNQNARILYDQNGKIALMYVFADDTSVIIAKTEDAVREVMIRLAGSRVKK